MVIGSQEWADMRYNFKLQKILKQFTFDLIAFMYPFIFIYLLFFKKVVPMFAHDCNVFCHRELFLASKQANIFLITKLHE